MKKMRMYVTRGSQRAEPPPCEPITDGPSLSIVKTWRCVTCRGEWTLEGSYAWNRCNRCGRERPAEDR